MSIASETLPKWQAARENCQNGRLANVVPQKSFFD
jgi:hypothetical protein